MPSTKCAQVIHKKSEIITNHDNNYIRHWLAFFFASLLVAFHQTHSQIESVSLLVVGCCVMGPHLVFTHHSLIFPFAD
jgi:hypothetical protein